MEASRAAKRVCTLLRAIAGGGQAHFCGSGGWGWLAAHGPIAISGVDSLLIVHPFVQAVPEHFESTVA
jgi:hypothetical protein